MRTDLEALKKFTKDELVMRVEKLENSNTRLTSELQECLIESVEDILGDFDENGDAVDVKVNGYTNMETYRLCLVLDNTEYWKEDILQTFFRLVREDEFSANDINIIDWNEVIERYSDDLIETHIHHHNE